MYNNRFDIQWHDINKLFVRQNQVITYEVETPKRQFYRIKKLVCEIRRIYPYLL